MVLLLEKKRLCAVRLPCGLRVEESFKKNGVDIWAVFVQPISPNQFICGQFYPPLYKINAKTQKHVI